MEFMPSIINLTNFFTALFQEKRIKYFFPLDMDYFLHEFDNLDNDDFCEEGFYIF